MFGNLEHRDFPTQIAYIMSYPLRWAPCWGHSFVGPCWGHSFGTYFGVLTHFSQKVIIFSHFCMKLTFWDIFFLEGRFSKMNFRRRHVPPSFSACFDRGPFNHPSDRGPFNHPADRGPFNNISHINIYIYIYIYPYRSL